MPAHLGGAASTGSQPFFTHPQALSPADATRIAGYRALLDFYNGNQWEGLPAPNERLPRGEKYAQ